MQSLQIAGYRWLPLVDSYMDNKELNKALARAIAFASEVHAGHLDRGGKPYILHPLRVMTNILKVFNGDPRAAIVAICHDTIEDGWAVDFETGFREFEAQVTTDSAVVMALRLLTHKPEDNYFDYIRNLVIQKGTVHGDYAIAVKIEDLKDNSDITRLKGLRSKDIDRLIKYHASYCYLTGQSDKLLDLV